MLLPRCSAKHVVYTQLLYGERKRCGLVLHRHGLSRKLRMYRISLYHIAVWM